MTQKERVQTLRAAGFRGYDKSLDSKACRPEYYGVRRTDAADAALQAVATAQDGAGAPGKGKARPCDRHRHKGRISARMPHEQMLRVKDAVRSCGYGTVQNWIGTCAYRLLLEADKRCAKKGPSCRANAGRGQRENVAISEYHETGEFVKCAE